MEKDQTMMSRSRRAITATLTLGMATSLVACGGGSAGTGDASHDLTIWVYSDFTQGESGALMEKYVEQFKSDNPNVGEVNLVPKNDSELLSGLLAGVGLPDAFSASARDAREYKEIVGLLDLSEVFADPEYADGYYDSALDAVSTDDGVWAIPFISYIPIIYRNLDVLEEAGVDANEGIPTYEAFLDQLEAVDATGLSATHSWTNGGYYAPGAVMASDAQNITVGVENGQTTIEPSQLVRTFETVQAIEQFANQSMSTDADVTLEAFKTNELAYFIGGPWHEPAFVEAGTNYDFVLVPPYEEGGWTGGLQGWDFFYGVDSEDDERDALVREFMKILGSYEAQKEWTMNVGRPTLREDVMSDPEVVESSEMAKVSAEGLQNGMMQMEFMDSTVFWPSAMNDPVASLGAGQLSPEETAESFVDEINALYADAGE